MPDVNPPNYSVHEAETATCPNCARHVKILRSFSPYTPVFYICFWCGHVVEVGVGVVTVGAAEEPLELNVAERAIMEYRRRLDHLEKQRAFLETQTFHMGDYVQENYAPYRPRDMEVGKVVGWDFENEYYRVHFSESMPYRGIEERFLIKWEGEPPEHLVNVPAPGVVRYIGVNLTDEVMDDRDMEA